MIASAKTHQYAVRSIPKSRSRTWGTKYPNRFVLIGLWKAYARNSSQPTRNPM